MQLQKEKIIIISTVFVDVLGIGIIIPVLPFYLERFESGAMMLTALFSVFSLCSFLSAPVLGALSDRIGRRPVLLLSIFSTAAGWFVFASAGKIWVLFLGRIIDGMAAGNFPIAQSYLSDISKNEKERTANFGVIGAIFGIAFIVGPVFGSLLSSISPAFPFWFAGGLAAANLVGAIFFLPETHNDRKKGGKINFNPFVPIGRAMKDVLLRSRYAAWFFFGLATSMLQAIFALYLGVQFGIKTTLIGFIFAGMGGLMAFNQGILLKRFWLKKFQESFLEIWLFIFFAVAFLLMGIGNIYIFLFGLVINVFAQSILRVVISSRVSGMAGKEKRGEVMGVMASVLSAAMITGPLIAGVVFEAHPSLPFVFGALSLLAAFVVMKFACKPGQEKYDQESIVPEVL